MNVRASVVIPTYNRAELLSHTLHSLTQQDTAAADFDVIVSDDGSTDHTARIVRDYGETLNIRYVYHDDLGHRTAATRNAGATLATGGILVFLDAGTLACTDFIGTHLRLHADLNAPHAVVGRMGGYDSVNASALASLGPRLASTTALTATRVRELGLIDMRDAEIARFGGDLDAALLPWRLFWTGNCSMPTVSFRDVGGFDERFVGWGVEDVDLGYRLSRAGLMLKWSDEALAVEYPHERATSANAENNFRNHRRFLETHLDPEIELFIAARRWGEDVHDAALEYRAWAARPNHHSTRGETHDISSFSRRRAVFGPIRRDRDDVVIAPHADDDGLWRRSIGLHTRLPSRIFESVHISGFYHPIWNRWRHQLLAEARRLASDVTLDPVLET